MRLRNLERKRTTIMVEPYDNDSNEVERDENIVEDATGQAEPQVSGSSDDIDEWTNETRPHGKAHPTIPGMYWDANNGSYSSDSSHAGIDDEADGLPSLEVARSLVFDEMVRDASTDAGDLISMQDAVRRVAANNSELLFKPPMLPALVKLS